MKNKIWIKSLVLALCLIIPALFLSACGGDNSSTGGNSTGGNSSGGNNYAWGKTFTYQGTTMNDYDSFGGNNGTHTRTCKTDSSHTQTTNCFGGKATCTTKAVCEGCKEAYGEIVAHNITKYGGKDSTGHWDTCSTCNGKFNFEEHTYDRESPDETNSVKCTKCGLLIAPAKQRKGLSGKAVAGIIIGSVAVVVLGGFVIWLRLRKSRCRVK